MAASGTDEERSRYWHDVVYTERRGRRLGHTVWIDKPPADVKVLLGFVRSAEHRAWVEVTREYNLRGDERTGAVTLISPELAADIICLYDRDSDDVAFYESPASAPTKNLI